MTHQESATQQIHRLRGELNQVQTEIEDVESDLIGREEDLRAFEFEFEAQVGYLMAQLVQLEAEVNDYLQQIKVMRTERTFGEGYRTVEDQYNATWNTPRQKNFESKRPPKPPPLTAARLKKVYRDLARRYHPDLAADEADRAYRTAKMTAINDAYKAGSLVEMMALAEEKEEVVQIEVGREERVERGTAVPTSQTEDDLVLILNQELERRRGHLFQVQDALRNFHHRPMVELALEVQFARKQGRDLLAEMAMEAQRKIARKEVERDMIKSQFDSLH